jgi:hypothetical protein
LRWVSCVYECEDLFPAMFTVLLIIFRRSPSFRMEDHSEYSLLNYHGYVRRTPSRSPRLSPGTSRTRRHHSPKPPPTSRGVREHEKNVICPQAPVQDPRQEDMNNLWATSQLFRPTLTDPALELLRSAFNLSSVPEYVSRTSSPTCFVHLLNTFGLLQGLL